MADALLQEVEELVTKVKPQWCRKPWHRHGGKGFVEDSLFVIGHCRIIWLVILADGHVAYKLLSPEGLELYQELILDSPVIFVEYDCDHQIKEFVAAQEKVVPEV